MSEIGSGSGSGYPTALDTNASPEVDDSTIVRADVPNDLTAAVLAVQGEVGITGSQNFLRSDAQAILTAEGGVAVKMTNKTGVASVKGTLVVADTTTDNAFDLTGANSADAIGIVYEDGIADGSECYVVVSGIAQVLLKDSTASTRGYWVKTSDTVGQADATTSTPPGAAVEHWQEIGHCLESQGSGSDVLAKVVLHFN